MSVAESWDPGQVGAELPVCPVGSVLALSTTTAVPEHWVLKTGSQGGWCWDAGPGPEASAGSSSSQCLSFLVCTHPEGLGFGM